MGRLDRERARFEPARRRGGNGAFDAGVPRSGKRRPRSERSSPVPTWAETRGTRPSEEPPKLGTSHPLAAQARRARLDRALRDLFTPGLSARVLDRHLDMIEREHAFLRIGTARSAPPPLT